MGIQDDIKRLEIRNERLHRLRLLEYRQAQQGIETPPHVVIEIAETKAELGLSDLLVAEKASGAFADEIGPEGRFLVTTRLMSQLARQVEQLGTQLEQQGQATKDQIDTQRQQIEQRIETQGQSIEGRIDRVEEHQAIVNARQDTERTAGQKRMRLAVFTIAVALLILVGGVVSIVSTLKQLGL